MYPTVELAIFVLFFYIVPMHRYFFYYFYRFSKRIISKGGGVYISLLGTGPISLVTSTTQLLIKQTLKHLNGHPHQKHIGATRRFNARRLLQISRNYPVFFFNSHNKNIFRIAMLTCIFDL